MAENMKEKLKEYYAGDFESVMYDGEGEVTELYDVFHDVIWDTLMNKSDYAGISPDLDLTVDIGDIQYHIYNLTICRDKIDLSPGLKDHIQRTIDNYVELQAQGKKKTIDWYVNCSFTMEDCYVNQRDVDEFDTVDIDVEVDHDDFIFIVDHTDDTLYDIAVMIGESIAHEIDREAEDAFENYGE